MGHWENTRAYPAEEEGRHSPAAGRRSPVAVPCRTLLLPNHRRQGGGAQRRSGGNATKKWVWRQSTLAGRRGAVAGLAALLVWIW